MIYVYQVKRILINLLKNIPPFEQPGPSLLGYNDSLVERVLMNLRHFNSAFKNIDCLRNPWSFSFSSKEITFFVNM